MRNGAALAVDFLQQGKEDFVGLGSSPYYAPTVFAADQEAKGITKRQFAAAMRRLFDDNKIRVETFGKPSRQSAKIVLCS
jgi:hypothetical protein